MTPGKGDLCVFAIKRGNILNKELYCNALYPYYKELMGRFKRSKYVCGIMSDFLWVNPKTNCSMLKDDDKVSFVPMTNVQEKNNVVSYNTVSYKQVKKGFTMFARGDLIWAKITPCMQNGKSCSTENMPTEIGFGSTEFHVIRKKNSDIYMPFIWAIMTNEKVLKAAQATFSGSAGQQRVPASFIEDFPAVIPKYQKQIEMVSKLKQAILDFLFSISRNATKNILNKFDPLPRVERLYLAHIKFDEAICELIRIDGNHRLSAASDVTDDFTLPFCLLLFRNPNENEQFTRAIFHNINAKQIPLNLEENLKVILESEQVFPNEVLKTDNSFGWKYYLTRKTIQELDFSYFSFINSYISSAKYSFFVDLYGFLIKNGSIQENEEAVETIKVKLTDVENALKQSEIVATTTNIAVIGALAYYRLTNEFKYRGFLSWIKKNNIGNVEKLHIEDMINLYDEIFEHVPKRAFLARWYPADTDAEYNQSVHRVNAIKEVAEELNLQLTDLGTRDTGIFDIRQVMYQDIKECDIFIADLTGARHNVMIEVGYALKHIDTGRMVFYFQETDSCKNVPFNVNHFSYDKITDSAEIKIKTKERIMTILEQSKKGEI